MWKDCTGTELIIINPDVRDKKDLFEKMVNHAYNQDLVINAKEFLQALWERENRDNTEIEEGIALPHARSSSVERFFLCVIVFRDGFDYQHEDKGPVNIVFFFGAPEEENRQYLQMLARSSRLLKHEDFRQGIIEAQTPEDVMRILEKHDHQELESEGDAFYQVEIVLHRIDRLDDTLAALVELGITNGQIIEATSIARKLAYDMPVFAGLSYHAEGRSTRSWIIRCFTRDAKAPDHIEKLLRENGIDLTKPNQGFIQAIKLNSVAGQTEEQIDL